MEAGRQKVQGKEKLEEMGTEGSKGENGNAYQEKTQAVDAQSAATQGDEAERRKEPGHSFVNDTNFAHCYVPHFANTLLLGSSFTLRPHLIEFMPGRLENKVFIATLCFNRSSDNL